MPSVPLPIGAPSDWMSLGPASRLLGVDPDTLRRWADGGRIRAFATPGGHRRFSRADLDRIVAAKRPPHHLLAKLGATPDRVSRAYARAYRGDGSPAGLGRFEADARAALRTEGRRLVAVLLAYLDAERPADRARWEAEAMSLIGATATRLADAGATMPEVVEIYLRARQPLLGELGALGRRRALEATHLAALFEDAVALLDRLLLHLVGAYPAAEAATRPAKEI